LISDIVRMTVEAYCAKMRGGTLRLQAQYLRRIRLPMPGDIPTHLQIELAEAFRSDDRTRATRAARQAYGLEEGLDE